VVIIAQAITVLDGYSNLLRFHFEMYLL